MKLIKSSYSIIEPTGYTIEDIYKSIELAGKVSHKSEHTIKEGSAKEFVDRMIRLGHGATLEFGTVYLAIPFGELNDFNLFENEHIADRYSRDEYSIVRTCSKDYWYVTSNYRVLIENNWLDDLKYICEPTEFHEKRICVKFICDRAIANEFVRHRKFSFLQESTRYCRYSSDKFNNELTFIKPCWCDAKEERYWLSEDNAICSTSYPNMIFNDIPNTPFSFLYSLLESEQAYFALLTKGWKPEQARAVLPNALKTELYMCGFMEDWKKFCELRCASNAHPQARELALPLQEEFINKKYIK